MSEQTSTQGQTPTPTPSDLSLEYARLRTKLTSSPKPTSAPSIHALPSDTAETISLLTSHSTTTPLHDNPLREVHFPHARPAGQPGTTKCVGRPGRPKLSIDTDVPIVSVPRFASRYGTPWRSAAPARYGPAEMTSAEMCGWLKGRRQEVVLGDTLDGNKGAVDDGEGGPWDEVEIGEGGGREVGACSVQSESDPAGCDPGVPPESDAKDLEYETRVRRDGVALGRMRNAEKDP